MSSAQIKLIYFNVRGKAEISRLVLAQAGVKYEDKRIENDEWPALKKTMPAGQLPALEYNGEVISQSLAIARFLAREFNLAGKNNWEMAKVDMIVDCVSDIRENIVKKNEGNGDRKAEGEKYLEANFLPFVKNMERILAKNGGKHFVGNEVSLADIFMANTLFSYDASLGSEWKKEAPLLEKLSRDILDLPNIKRWIQTRPKTDG